MFVALFLFLFCLRFCTVLSGDQYLGHIAQEWGGGEGIYIRAAKVQIIMIARERMNIIDGKIQRRIFPWLQISGKMSDKVKFRFSKKIREY